MVATFFLDSGSAISVTTLKTVRKFMLSLEQCSNNWNIRGVSGVLLRVVGKVYIKFYFKDDNYTHPFHVIEGGNIPGDILMGHDFMYRTGLTPNPATNTAHYKDMVFQLTPPGPAWIAQEEEPAPDGHDASAHVAPTPRGEQTTVAVMGLQSPKPGGLTAHLVNDVKLPPFTDCAVQVKLSQEAAGTALVMPDAVMMRGTCALPALYAIEEGGIFEMRIMNISPSTLSLQSGMAVAQVTTTEAPVEEVEFDMGEAAQWVGTIGIDKLVTQLPPMDHKEGEKILIDLFKDFPEILPSAERPLGTTGILKHRINLKEGAKPVYIPSYKIPHSRREQLKKATTELLEQGIIEPSNSPWSAPMLLVPKQDGSLRPVIDYRKLNDLTIPDRFPVPVIRLLLQEIGQSQNVFSTIDLKTGFHQVEVAEESKEVTAFSTPEGHFQFLKMPFGLRNAPITFSRLMALVLAGLIQNTVFLYLDDLLIVSSTIEEHEKKLRQVFQRLAEANLVINLQKSHFFKSSVRFLGHTLDKTGIRPNDDKVEDVRNFPIPTTVKKVKSFLGLSGFYRQYIEGYGKIAEPLTRLLKKDVKFNWDTPQQEAFDKLKMKLTTAPVLTFPNFDKPFYLATDASGIGIGAVLMQKADDGKLKPIAYASRRLAKAEVNYAATDLEALAVVWGLQKFRETILGYDVTVATDHQPLIPLLSNNRDTKGRVARWVTTVLEFNPKFIYIPGAKNKVPDALSRCFTIEIEALDVLDPETLREEQMKEPALGKIITYLKKGGPTPPRSRYPTKELFLEDDLLFRKSQPRGNKDRQTRSYKQLVIPESLVRLVLQLLHESPDAAHAGIDKAVKTARTRYYFPAMEKKIADHVRRCQKCPYYKDSTRAPSPALTYDVPDRPWVRVHCDTLSGFTTTARMNRYLVVFIDAFSRWCELVPVTDKSAVTVARAFLDNVVNRHQSPETLVSDNGTEFANEVLKELCGLLGVKKIQILPYRPQANGLCERLNRTILGMLRVVIPRDDLEWDHWIPTVQAAINSSYHRSLGDIPHFILYSHDRRLPYELLQQAQTPVYGEEDFARLAIARKQEAFKVAKEHLTAARDRMIEGQHKLARRKKMEIGMLVFKRVDRKGPMPKLAPAFSGPLRVLRLRHNKALLFDLNTTGQEWVHLDRLKLATHFYREEYEKRNPNVQPLLTDEVDTDTTDTEQ